MERWYTQEQARATLTSADGKSRELALTMVMSYRGKYKILSNTIMSRLQIQNTFTEKGSVMPNLHVVVEVVKWFFICLFLFLFQI